MPTTFVAGNLFAEPKLDAIAHGCNCAGAMGKGIAVEFKRRFPQMYADYRQRCADGTFKLGDVFTWREGDTVVFNLGTQKNWRSKAELPAVEEAVLGMIKEAESAGLRRIGLPRIGAGLGGLDWDTEVRPLLERVGDDASVELVVFETFVQA